MGNGMGLRIKLRGALGLEEGVLIGFLREASGKQHQLPLGHSSVPRGRALVMFSRLRRRVFGRQNGEGPENRERQKKATVHFWQRPKSSKEPASHPMLLSKKQVKKEEERLTTELQLMTRERNDLKDQLMVLTEGTVDNSPYKNHKPNALYEKVKMDHKQIMMELSNFENENTETLDNFTLLRKEIVFYRDLHSRLLMERTQLKKKVDELRQEERKLQNDWTVLKYHLEDLKMIHNEQEEEISYLKIQQQQIGAGNKTQFSHQQELKRLEESIQFLQKQREMVMQEKHLVQKLQHHFQVSQMRSETLQTHLEQAKVQDESHLEKDLQQEPPPNFQVQVEATGQCPVDINPLPIGSWATAALVQLLMAALMVKEISLGNLIDDTKSIQVPGSLEKSFWVIIQLRFPVRLEVCL
ncbi:hypothetical protein ACRRTK_009946 [Alexandromys fortis]